MRQHLIIRTVTTAVLAGAAATVWTAPALAGPDRGEAARAAAHGVSAVQGVSAGHGVSAAALRLGRATLPANDGWAADGTGTTGGSTADDAHIFVAHNRAELVTALGGNNTTNATNATPKIVFLAGRIDANVDDNNAPLSCADYADPGYTLPAFLAAYDPAVWGRTSRPTGALEDARLRSTKNQGARVNINVGPNTTLIGLGHAVVNGADLLIQKVDNVIVRNIEFQDAHDCFPSWDPTDGSTGNWNSLYDDVSVIGGTHVWVDHDSFDDGTNPDSAEPLYFDRPYQAHDGLLDITKVADLVTVSDSYLHDHDKTMLIGSSDSATTDAGKLRVTLHDNRFANLGQRAPRVRYGQVHAYNNLYQIPKTTGAFAVDGYSYSWGVGVSSALYAQNNFVVLGPGVDPAGVVHYWGGTAMTEIGTVVLAGGRLSSTSLLADYNAAHDPDIGTDAGWTPTLHTTILPTLLVPIVVGLSAGSGHLPT
jgi:pectate lyase